MLGRRYEKPASPLRQLSLLKSSPRLLGKQNTSVCVRQASFLKLHYVNTNVPSSQWPHSTVNMVPYFNPGGHNFAGMNLDGWGISQIVFITLYSIVFYAACGLVWHNRSIPVIKMRSVGLSILSLLVLHIYVVLVFLVYPLNGYWPCDVEYWVMAMYLPIGIGLFQAQNQQLLIVSRGQQRLLLEPLAFKPLGRGWSRLRFWWSEQSYKRRAVTYVVIGGVIQVSLAITSK